MPELDPVLLLLEEMKASRAETQQIKAEVAQAKMEVASVVQTLHGPPGSNNGLYKSVKNMSTRMDEGFADINERIDTDIMPIVRDAKRGMSLREKMWLIIIAAVTSGLVGLAVSIIKG